MRKCFLNCIYFIFGTLLSLIALHGAMFFDGERTAKG